MIPYIKQKNEFDCGPTVAQMVLKYFDVPISYEEIKKQVFSDSKGTTWTIGIANCLADNNLHVEYYTKVLGINPKLFELNYYQKLTDGLDASKRKLLELFNNSIKKGVHIEEKTFSITEVLDKISKDVVCISLLDWGKIIQHNGYIGHFVPIVGYDENNIFVHNPDNINGSANFKIEKELFDIARKSVGTDEDLIFISKVIDV